MHRGYIKTWRCSQDNELYFDDTFSKWQAWQDLILLANWEDGSFIKRGVRFEVKRGMLAWSVKGLADRWKWSRHKVANFLNMLEKGHQIEHQKNTITTLIKIINYDKYQSKDIERDIKRTSKGHQKDTSKESKTLKESKEEKIIKEICGDFKNVHISKEELEKLEVKFGSTLTRDKIEKLSEYMESHGKKYKSHYATILSWSRKDNTDDYSKSDTTQELESRRKLDEWRNTQKKTAVSKQSIPS